MSYPLFEETHEVLGDLHGRYSLALVTNGHPAVQRQKARFARLMPYFEGVVVSGDIGSAKPDPALFRRALDALGVAPGEAVMVGDTLERDIVGARNAGIRSILVQRDAESSNESSRAGPTPDATVSDLTDLPAHLG